MSSHKNQHYVPRCLLKPFSLGAEGKSINLYNINADKFIENAPVKHQCSRNFFYGKDLDTERALANLEGEFTRISGLTCQRVHLSDEDVEWLWLFAIVQTRRTARAVAHLKHFNESLADEVFGDNTEQRPPDQSHDELVMLSMLSGLKFARKIGDLKLVLLDNKTNLDFVISDHPCIMSNRYNFEIAKVKGFGLASSGTFLVLPISPRIAALFFDIGVYTMSIPRGSRFVPILQRADVLSFNRLQQLGADQNIYFSDWADREHLIARNDRWIGEQRRLSLEIINFEPVQGSPGEFQRSNKPTSGAGPRVIQTSSRHPRPAAWPSQIKIRKQPMTYGNRSLAGEVRRAEWLRPGALDDDLD